jgi:hypothetical protein
MKTAKSYSVVLMLFVCFLFFPVSRAGGQQNQENPLPQFLFNQFTKGTVLMNDGRKHSPNLNYQMVDEEMIFEDNGKYLAMDKIMEVDTVYIGEFKFVPVEHKFYEVVSQGKYPFFIQNKSKFTSESTSTAYGMKSRVNDPTTFNVIRSGNQVRNLNLPDNVKVTREPVYWIMKDGQMKRFINQRQLLNIFPSDKDKIREYITKFGLDINSRKDLIQIANFCNNL